MVRCTSSPASKQNLGRQRIGGIDFGLTTTTTSARSGRVSIGIDGTYYLQYKEETLKGRRLTTSSGSTTVSPVKPSSTTSRLGGLPDSGLLDLGHRQLHPVACAMRTASVACRSYDPNPAISGFNLDKQHKLPKIRDYYTIDLLLSYEFHYKPPERRCPLPRTARTARAVAARRWSSSAQQVHGDRFAAQAARRPEVLLRYRRT